MKFILIPFSLLITSGISYSQQERFLIPAGTIVNTAIPSKHQYQYPEFTKGKVIFRDGKESRARMNYNRLNDEMHFIGPLGDTLAVDNEATIRLVLINEDSFFYQSGYIQLLDSKGGFSLGVKHEYKISAKRKIGAYETESPASSITSYDSYFDGAVTHKLKVKENAVVTEQTSYFFGDRFYRFIPATKKNLIKHFPGCRTSIRKFCRKNDIDFKDRESLAGLLSYVSKVCR